MIDLTALLLILPRLQAATLASRWQASVVHLEQAYCLSSCIDVATTVAKSVYYTRLWASFFVKLREKIPGRGLRFFGLI